MLWLYNRGSMVLSDFKMADLLMFFISKGEMVKKLYV